MEYVLGFNFVRQGRDVVLIKKDKPAWQKGFLNGVGGKIEKGETKHAAMCREYREETGERGVCNWTLFCCLLAGDAQIYCFKSHSVVTRARTVTRERVFLVDIYRLLHDGEYESVKCLPNLNWLIPLALSESQTIITRYV